MLLWFPTPYPDELLYSVYARYHVRSGNTSPKMTTEDLFGTRTFRSVLDLPANVNNLVEQLGPRWKADHLVLKHTMYAYYAPFLMPEQGRKVNKSMKTNEGSVIHTRAGVSASIVKPKRYLWICPECTKEDMETYGETYWHRLPQLPGVFMCPNHEVVLEETTISTKMKNQHEYVIPTHEIESYPVDLKGLNEEDIKILLRIAKLTEMLLETQSRQKHKNDLREKYLVLLKRRGLISPHGFLKRIELYEDFNAHFSPQLLELLQSPVVFKETNWLTMIFQKHRKSFHPIRHLLTHLFLETDLNELFSEKAFYPFGKGPWLCLNAACEHYKKPVVDSLVVTRCSDTGRPVGTFSCECGFVYSRRGPDKELKDRFKIGRVKEYGPVWKEKLIELVNSGGRLMDISRELEANPDTIRKYAFQLNLKTSWKTPSNYLREAPNTEVKVVEDLLSEKKQKWVEVQNLYPDASKTELRKLVPDVYVYLYRHDVEWLNENSPEKKISKPVNTRVNWERRDEELLEMVEKVVQDWDIDAVKPTKISVSSIGRKINKLSLLQKKAEKLPKTINFIRDITESLDQYQIRRVDAVIEMLIEESLPIKEWEIYRLAGIRPTATSKVKRYIAKRTTEYESKELEEHKI